MLWLAITEFFYLFNFPCINLIQCTVVEELNRPGSAGSMKNGRRCNSIPNSPSKGSNEFPLRLVTERMPHTFCQLQVMLLLGRGGHFPQYVTYHLSYLTAVN